MNDVREATEVLSRSLLESMGLGLDLESQDINYLNDMVDLRCASHHANDVSNSLQYFLTDLEVLTHDSGLEKHPLQVLIVGNNQCSVLIMSEDSQLHELEQLSHDLVRLTELLEDLLHLGILLALVVFLVLLLCFLLFCGLDHIGLVLVLLLLVEGDSVPDVLKRLTSLLLKGDVVLTDQVNKTNAGGNDVILLAKHHVDVAGELILFLILVRLDDIVQGKDQKIDTLQGKVGLNRLKVQAKEGAQKVSQASHVDELETPLTVSGVLLVAALLLINNLERI